MYMKNPKPDEKEKITLPDKLQREMMKFFMKTSVPKLAEVNKERQQQPPNSNEGGSKDG